MANDRNQDPANSNSTAGRLQSEGSQGSADNQTGQTEINPGNEREDDGGQGKPENSEFQKDSDEYRQNQQEEFKPDVDGDDHDGDPEGPTTADGSRISTSSND